MEANINFEDGEVFINGTKISLDEIGGVIPKLKGEVREANESTYVESIINFDERFTILGFSASIAIHYHSQSIKSICMLFNEMVFFDRTLMESKIIKKFEKKYSLDVESFHPAIAKIRNLTWGEACFLYDPRQGDLSLCLSYKGVR